MDEKIEAAPTDRISQLPEEIIHRIFSKLSTKDVIRAKVWSKMWQCVCSSFPVTDFSDSLFGIPFPWPFSSQSSILNKEEVQVYRERFINFVNTCLQSQCQKNGCIQVFRLTMCMHKDEEKTIQNVIDRWIELAAEFHVQELDIQIQKILGEYRYPDATIYVLPRTILCSDSLNILKLRHLILLRKSDFNTSYKICLPCLRVLSLDHCQIEEEFIRNLTTGCPMIGDFALIQCRGFEVLQLSGFEKLKKVKVKSLDVWKIHIAVSSLQILHLSGDNWIDRHKEFIDIAACINLRVLKLKFPSMSHQLYQDIGPKFPLLKVFVLKTLIASIKISCPLLQKLKLVSRAAAHELIIEAPHLQSLNYDIGAIPSFIRINSSSFQKININLLLHRYMDEFTTHNFVEIRKFLRNFGHIDCLNLTISTVQVKFSIPEDLECTLGSPLPEVKHLKLDIDHLIDTKGSFKTLIDGVFWSLRPHCISLNANQWHHNQIIQVLNEKLINERDCCRSSTLGCWRHYLKSYQIEGMTENTNVGASLNQFLI